MRRVPLSCKVDARTTSLPFRLLLGLLAPVALLLITPYRATGQAPSAVARDADGLALVKRVLDASGGVDAIQSVKSIVLAGTSSIPTDATTTVDTGVTISALGTNLLRIDSLSGQNRRSQFYNGAQILEQQPDGSVLRIPNADVWTGRSRYLPLLCLATAFSDPSFGVSRPEHLPEQEGTSLFRLHLTRSITSTTKPEQHSSKAEADLVLDGKTLTIVRVRFSHHDHRMTLRELRNSPAEVYVFSDYRPEGTLLLPHTVSAKLDQRSVWTLHDVQYRLTPDLSEDFFKPTSK